MSAAKQKEVSKEAVKQEKVHIHRRCRFGAGLSPEDKPDMSKMIAMIKRENHRAEMERIKEEKRILAQESLDKERENIGLSESSSPVLRGTSRSSARRASTGFH